MNEVEEFGLAVLVGAVAAVVAVLSNRLSERIRVPAPAIFLFAAAVASDLWPRLGSVSVGTVENVVSLALAVILFDGGMHIGWRRFRVAAGPTVWVGVVGTFVTAGAFAVLAHVLFAFSWRTSLLLGTALAPTDPAVVFSVLGRREIAGRTGILLEGESGANDPVGIALLIALVAATGGIGQTAGAVAVTFVLQMVVGAAVGLVGGWALLLFMRHVPLPSEGLYSLRVLASVMVLFGLATVAHGSGFLAVFVAGVLIGDERAPYKREIERFHSSVASMAEIVAFVLLGLTIKLEGLGTADVWVTGLILALLLAFVVRPLLVGAMLLPVRLRWGERAFVLWTGLKGAVPILLGTFILTSGVPGAQRLYGIIFVVVAFSVLVQGSLVPSMSHWLGIPLRMMEPEPWSVGVRLRQEPEGLRRLRVAPGSKADGSMVEDLPVSEGFWISMVIRSGQLVPLTGGTSLRAGDEILALADTDHDTENDRIFTQVGDGGPG